MPETRIGRELDLLSTPSRGEFKSDLEKISTVPPAVLSTVISKAAATYPCSNIYEIAALVAQQHGITDPQDTFDAASVAIYLWENSEGDSIQSVMQDLKSLGFLSERAAPILSEMLQLAAPLRESAKVASKYLRLGSPLFANLRGTVDIRCRFHKTDEDFRIGKQPTEIVDVQQVILANLRIVDADQEERTVSFLMDESDLRDMKRFVSNMERELELTKDLIGKPE